MIFMRILPGVLKELTKHVPTVLFQVVEWSDLASELPKISRRILQKEGYEALLSQQMKVLEPFHVTLTHDPLKQEPVKMDKWSGEKFLEVYFAQLFSPHGVFLDLRTMHFTTARPDFRWCPSGLWTVFSENFRSGLLDVYEGFYLGKDDLYHEGLVKIGLVSASWPEKDKQQLAELFRAQFGNADDTEMSFDMAHFNASMVKTFNFILKKKSKITKDFLYLGIYLVTLYSSLEQTKEKLAVKEVFLRVRGQFRTT